MITRIRGGFSEKCETTENIVLRNDANSRLN